MTIAALPILGLLIFATSSQALPAADEQALFQTARRNGKLASEGFRRCRDYLNGWLELADPATGLIPRNRKDRYWNAEDAAADNYPFMVLSTWFTDRALFDGRMRDMLRTEIKLTSRSDALPDAYDFNKPGFLRDEPDLDRLIFGAAEYVKDGLLPLTEWLGPSPWSERMIAILDSIWEHAPVETPHGRIPSTNVEVNGEMLQTLSRVYWMTGKQKYLEWAIRLGDYHLLGDRHPTRDLRSLRLRDHGCEIISGLCELYATVHFARPGKKNAYQAHVHEMLDRILEVGTNEHGLFFDAIDPVAGTVTGKRLADTWGYTFNGIHTVYLIDGTERYRDAVLKALSNIGKYRNHQWEGQSSDGYADSIESALNLYNREPVAETAEWMDSEIKVMWNKQQPDGIIEGWHGDGNFARTTLMYCLWKTQGASIHPWREDVEVGAVAGGEFLHLTLTAGMKWSGKLRFDTPRHKIAMKLPLDWPRINQFPEWFVAEPGIEYALHDIDSGATRRHDGMALLEGLPLSLQDGQTMRLRISAHRATPEPDARKDH